MMTTIDYQPVADLLARVRSRWRRLEGLHALVRLALTAAGVLVAILLLAKLIDRAPAALAVLGCAGVLGIAAAGVWAFWPLRAPPSDRRVARFIEERKAGLDERLVSAVGAAAAPRDDESPLAASMMADAARVASAIDPADVVSTPALRQAVIQSGASVMLCASIVFLGWQTLRQAADAASLALFPSRVVLEVTPGDARVQAGSDLTVEARLVGNQAPVVAQLLVTADWAGPDWRALEMPADAANRFTLALSALTKSFRYKVVAGPVTSSTYHVAVVRPPRATRIDLRYVHPKALGLPDRLEEDGGDVYAPEGTSVRLTIHTDLPAATGRMQLPGDRSIALTGSGRVLEASLQVNEDTSYRLTLADAEGLTSRGDTEYFIRMIEDRPPEVRVVRPASDRRVTPLEEVDIEAEAEDDFGIASLDLVYAVRGGAEKVVPLRIAPRAASATGRHTLYLEDLDVRPGDFVSYYVRGRDLARGKRSSEARSDIFFLDVKPFEEEFTLAQTQAAMGGGQANQQLDDLVSAQKQIIVATWKLDRRARAASGAKSEEDIRAVARAEAELKARVEQASTVFRQSTLRDPRRSPGGRGLPRAGGPRAGQTLAEEDAMSAAAAAMGAAVASLSALKTTAAIPSEMEALNHLLRAQADVRKRQIQQQAGGGPGGNRSTQDLSSLFDKELARQQQTNYETQKSAQEQTEPSSELDKIKELARRQDELLGRQRELARDRERMSAEERTRALESLTREQNALRQEAEEMSASGSPQPGQQSQSRQGQGARQTEGGRQTGEGRQSGEPKPGESQARGGESGRELREISEEMRGATSDLRRQDAGQASARASRALEKLRELEQRLQSRTPDGRRRALGDLQLEARQLADAERQIAAESRRAEPGESGKDTLRRLAGEQQRLAERVQRVQEGLRQQAGRGDPGAAPSNAPGTAERQGPDDAQRLQRAAGEAARELDRQRLAERMEQSADAMRAAAEPAGRKDGSSRSAAAALQEEIARALDRIADRLSAADRSGDADSRKLSEQIARARELRERLDDLARQLGSDPTGQDADRLRADVQREMERVRELLRETDREHGTQGRGAAGFTFEGHGMVLSAPGTEAFKQDFARWQELKRQAAAALEQVESTLSQRVQERDAKDRLASGADDRAPAAYQEQVDSYFRALATKKKPR